MTDPTVSPSALSRRNLLRAGGVVSFGAVVAACGGGQSSDAPGRVGYAAPITDPPPADVTDAVLLRTAASLQYTAIEVLQRVLDEQFVGDQYTAIIERFVDDHTAHAEHVNELVSDADGEPFTCPNPWLQDRAVEPMFAAIVGDEEEGLEPSDDPQRDALSMITNLENLLAASYQALAAKLGTPELRREAALIAATEARHAALIAYTVNTEAYVDPAVTSAEPQGEATGHAPVYAITSRLGSVTGITFRLGRENAEGAIPEVILETPAENAYVYDYVTC